MAAICTKCQDKIMVWGEFCPSCGEAVEYYAKPAGFWIRVGASIIDFLVFFPIVILSYWNMFNLKSIPVLVLISLPGLIYKPFMEAFFGATLGKMACGIRVVDSKKQKLSLVNAYVRFIPFIAQAALALTGSIIFYNMPVFESIHSFADFSQYQQELKQQGNTFVDTAGLIINILIVIDCLFVAFSFRKRALHDMLAESYCIYREP